MPKNPKGKGKGFFVIERGVIPSFHGMAVNAGWDAVMVSPNDVGVSDDVISIKYGQGRKICLTHDNSFHTHNEKKGFVGFLYYDTNATRSKEHLKKLEAQMSIVLHTNTNKTLAKKITTVGITGVTQVDLPTTSE